MIDWLYSNALGAAALAVVAGVLIWAFRPGPAVRHALWLVVLLKLVSPTGLWVSVPLPVKGPAVEEAVASAPLPELDDVMVGDEEFFTVEIEGVPSEEPAEPGAAVVAAVRVDREVAPAAVAAAEPFNYRPYLIAAWVVGAGYFGWRSIRESVRFSRFVRRSVPAGDYLAAEVAAVARSLGVRAPAVRVLAGLSSPLMWCLGRPVLLWPAGLECRLKGEGRRAVIAHELAHLRRRDHWVRRLEMVAAILHWWNPLFWVARRRLRADAELACDAWAAGQADRRAYAEALLEVCSFNHRRRPAPAVGVSGEGRRAMQERLTMIMRDHVPCRLAFGAKLVVALMAVAAVPAWTLGQSKPIKVEAAGDPDIQKIEAQLKALTEKLEAVKAAQAAVAAKKAAEAERAAAEAAKAKVAGARDKLKLLTEAQGKLVEKTAAAPNVKVLTAGQDGVKVIGADGKELKDVRVIIVEKKVTGQGGAEKAPAAAGQNKIELRLASPPGKAGPQAFEWKVAPQELKPGTTTDKKTVELKWATPAAGARDILLRSTAAGAEGQTVTLSRATYKLDKGQADALAGLLGSVKANVLEVKVDGNTLTLTTTPDVQATVGQIVRLITGQGTGGTAIYRVAPVPPVPPVPPAAPAKPVKPSAQGGQYLPGEKTEVEFHVVPDLKADGKEIRVEFLKDHLKEVEKLKALKELEKLKDLKELKELKDLKIELNLDDLKDLKLDAAELKARIEKAVEAAKGTEKKPAGPAK